MPAAASRPNKSQPVTPASGQTAAVRPFEKDDFDRDVYCVFGLPIDAIDLPAAVALLGQAPRIGQRIAFVTPNVNMLCAAQADPVARADILSHDLSLADGAPVARLARFFGAPIRQRCAGSDVFEGLKSQPGFAGRRIRVFFFGGRDGAAEAAARQLNKSGGGLESAGWLNPGHGDVASMSDDATIAKINAAKPDLVVVSLGFRKGNAWIRANASRLDAPLVSHLGAVVDFVAGTVERAPREWRAVGLEWLWRIKAERSLWRRYATDMAAFVGLLAVRAPLLTALQQRKSGTSASASVDLTGARIVVRLNGDLVAGGLDPVRAAFRKAASAGRDVVLDFEGCDAIDVAFLGLVLMLEKKVVLNGRAITLARIGARQHNLFKLNGLGYKREVVEIETDEFAGAARSA